MNLNKFDSLQDDEERLAVMLLSGKCIATRKEEDSNIALYQLFSFYVEVWYENNLSEIYQLRSFDSTDELEPYFEEIDISSLTVS